MNFNSPVTIGGVGMEKILTAMEKILTAKDAKTGREGREAMGGK
jgi:hypothetical protein